MKIPTALAFLAAITALSYAQPVGAPGRLSDSQAVERWIGPSTVARLGGLGGSQIDGLAVL